jgi:hypothetical protein
LSPDGRTLAYLLCTRGHIDIVKLDLATGTRALNGLGPSARVGERLAFSADGNLLYGLNDEMQRLAYVANENAPSGGLGIASWVFPRAGHADEYLVVKGEPGQVNVARGPAPFTMGPLFRLPDDPVHLAVDASGDHVLAVVDDTLYRWSEGDEAPTKIADGIVTAAWVPDGSAEPSPEPEPGPEPNGQLPNGIAAVRDGELVVLGGSDGEQHSSLGDVPEDSVLSATADGRTWVLGPADRPSDCDFDDPDPRGVEVLETTSGNRRRLVGNAYSPAVSSRGLVAFGYACDGDGIGFTRLATGENFRSDALGGRESESDPRIRGVWPVAWSPDGSRLLSWVRVEGEQQRRLFVASLWPAVPAAETRVVEVPTVGDEVTAAAFVDDETVALAVRTGSDAGLMIDGREEVRLPEAVTSLVTDPSGQHFLFVTVSGELWRWTRGESGPAPVAAGVSAAIWLPWS